MMTISASLKLAKQIGLWAIFIVSLCALISALRLVFMGFSGLATMFFIHHHPVALTTVGQSIGLAMLVTGMFLWPTWAFFPLKEKIDVWWLQRRTVGKGR